MHNIEEKSMNPIKHFKCCQMVTDIRLTNLASKGVFKHKTEYKTIVLIQLEYFDQYYNT